MANYETFSPFFSTFKVEFAKKTIKITKEFDQFRIRSNYLRRSNSKLFFIIFEVS